MPDQAPSMPPLPEAFGYHSGFAWMTAHRSECQITLKRQAEPGYEKPLYTAEQVQAVAEERVRVALEQAVKLCDAERAEFMEQAGHNNGRQSDMAYGSVNSAERLAEAIRTLIPARSLGE